MNGYVYIIEKEDGSIKIGRSINPKTRLSFLETQGGFNIKRKYISPMCGNSN
ncbi:GIY-YIG nuclease family protein, partial [Caloramator mitchellensis]|uniref:GIY-YIG nuclease family protein n=1 Tax=Caloramator mitchellensis TaxID=908809 RepID=UPI00128F596E